MHASLAAMMLRAKRQRIEVASAFAPLPGAKMMHLYAMRRESESPAYGARELGHAAHVLLVRGWLGFPRLLLPGAALHRRIAG